MGAPFCYAFVMAVFLSACPMPRLPTQSASIPTVRAYFFTVSQMS